MQGRRPGARLKSADAAVGRHEIKARLWLDQLVDLERAKKMRKIGAAAHADVLASVDQLPGGAVVEGAGPAAEAIARFQERDAKPARRQRRRRRQARQSTADDNDAWLHLTLTQIA